MNFKSRIHRFLKSGNAIYLLLAIVTIALYTKTIFYKFTYMDDNVLVMQRTQFLNSFANIIKSFQEPVFYLGASFSVYYRPVLNVFFILEYRLFTQNFYGYHLFNILIHLINVFLVYRLFRKLKIDSKVSLVSTLLFSVHPVLTQAVAWVPGLNDLLLTLFFLPSLLYLVNYLETRSLKDLFFFLLFFTLSIFTKEIALVFIFIYFVVYLVTVRKRKLKELTSIFLPTLVVILVFFYFR